MVFYQCPLGPYGDDVLCTAVGPSVHKGFYYVQHNCLVTEVHESDMREAQDDLLHHALKSFDDMMSLGEVCQFDQDVHQGMLKLAGSVLLDDMRPPPDDNDNKKCPDDAHVQNCSQPQPTGPEDPEIELPNVYQPENEDPRPECCSDFDDTSSEDDQAPDNDSSNIDDEVVFVKVVRPSEVEYVMTRRPCRELRL